MTGAWCRACGTDQQPEAGHVPGDRACAACGAPCQPWQRPESRIGLAYRVAGRLRVTKRLAICIDESHDQVVLHLGPKEKDAAVATRVDALGEPTDAVPADLSPAGRLHHAALEAAVKQHWDIELLVARAAELVDGSLPAERQLADEALGSGWDDLYDALPLSPSEKVWRRAHEAACYARVDDLREHLERLPPVGYGARVLLALPFAPAISADERWRPLVDGWVASGLPGADAVRRLVDPAWDVALGAAVEILPADRAGAWRRAGAALAAEAAVAPAAETPGWWRAADVYLRGMEGQVIDDELAGIAGLDVSLLEDLVDLGGLTGAAPLALAPDGTRTVLRSRLTPADLAPEELSEVGHTAELARRAFIGRDRTALGRLRETGAVRHYAALLDARETGVVDEQRLRPDGIKLLRLAERALAALRGGETRTLPGPLLDDPTTWPMFAAEARDGHLAPDGETRDTRPAFSHWCDLERLLGLVWEHRWDDAIALGQTLAPALTTERYHDEALNLVAFAMTQVGRHGEALELLERAMDGNYTEALLVNTGHTAARVEPERAIPHLVRLVGEAPTQDLRVNALRQAVEVWTSAPSMTDLPSELTAALELVLTSGCGLDDYVQFVSLAARRAPALVARLPAPSDERSGPYRLHLAHARLELQDGFTLADLAATYVDMAREHGRPEWFTTAWSADVDAVRQSMIGEAGSAPGSAEFVDVVNMQMPELFTQFQRFLLVPQAGAHLAARFADQGTTLNVDHAFPKFFFLPIEEFLSERHKLDNDLAKGLALVFHESLRIAGAHYLRVSRLSSEQPYNELVARLRWDHQNALAIRRQMLANLDADAGAQQVGDRIVDRLLRLDIDDTEERERRVGLEAMIADWRSETVRLRALF